MTTARRRARTAPDRGDAVWLTFDSPSGHEQSGRRPAIIISPRVYNSRSGLAIACPISSRVKGYPFEVALPAGLPVSGVILADQLRTFDWHARDAKKICTVPAAVTEEILGKVRVLVGRE